MTSNTYDEARAGYANFGKLTTSVNAAATHIFDYDGDGAVRHQKLTDASGAHETYAVQIYGQTAYKLYYPGGLAVGSDASRWTYENR